MPVFFQQASNKLDLSKNGIMLDLCCGRGELASGFSGYVNKVIAIDGSTEMLDHSIHRDNVTYHCADVNNDEMLFFETVDSIVIGSAIHWITRKKIFDVISKNLSNKGKIFITHTLFNLNQQPYAAVLKELNRKYGREDGLTVDFSGKEKLNLSEFIQTESVRLIQHVSIDPSFLYHNQLSYAYKDFHQIIAEKKEEYKQEFFHLLSPFFSNGRIHATLVNWGLIYSRI